MYTGQVIGVYAHHSPLSLMWEPTTFGTLEIHAHSKLSLFQTD